MQEHVAKPEGMVKSEKIFSIECGTGLRANCHVCASRDVELVHVNHIRKSDVYHKCPICKSRIGINGPHPACSVCQ